ncbi:hypothetical protein O3P69_014719 [Scylla paramamosain]|uniref:Uncharacterized protein n=1 Tax=Scylla paramamosain TaxID=85552 RepID=A0AAW0U0T4_SCYPA
MFGIKDLLFVDPTDAKYVFDNTAIKNCQPKSVFRIKRDDCDLDENGEACGLDDYENDVFLSLVDNDNDIIYPEIVRFSERDSTETIEAPDYSPVYQHGSNPEAQACLLNLQIPSDTILDLAQCRC